MGLAASAGRESMLTARKSDIEFKVQVINQRRTTLAQQASQLARAFANAMYQTDESGVLGGSSMVLGFTASVTGGVPQEATGTGWYEAQMQEVQSLDKELELREKDLQTQNKIVETELDVVRKVIDKSIEKGFKTLG